MQFKSYFCSCMSCFNTSVYFFSASIFESFMCFHLFYPVLMNHVTWCLTSPSLYHTYSCCFWSLYYCIPESYGHRILLSHTKSITPDSHPCHHRWLQMKFWVLGFIIRPGACLSWCFHLSSLKSLTCFIQTGSTNLICLAYPNTFCLVVFFGQRAIKAWLRFIFTELIPTKSTHYCSKV